MQGRHPYPRVFSAAKRTATHYLPIYICRAGGSRHCPTTNMIRHFRRVRQNHAIELPRLCPLALVLVRPMRRLAMSNPGSGSMPAEMAEEEFPEERGAKVAVAEVPIIDGGGDRVAASGISATDDDNIDFRRSWLQSSLKLD